MDIRKMLPIVLFFMTVLLVFNLAPSVQTANNTAYTTYNGCANKTYMIGLGTIMPWGDLLIILSIMVAAGLLSLQINAGSLGLKDVMKPILVVIICIFALNFYDSIITAADSLIGGTTNTAAKTFYGVILLFIYLAIIAASGGYETYRYIRDRKKKKSGAGGQKVTSFANL